MPDPALTARLARFEKPLFSRRENTYRRRVGSCFDLRMLRIDRRAPRAVPPCEAAHPRIGQRPGGCVLRAAAHESVQGRVAIDADLRGDDVADGGRDHAGSAAAGREPVRATP